MAIIKMTELLSLKMCLSKVVRMHRLNWALLFVHGILCAVIVYAHGRRLCSNRFRHGSTTISYPQCNLTFMRKRYLHRCREQSCAIRAYAMSAVGIDVVSDHKSREHC